MDEHVNIRDLAADTLAAIDRDGQFSHIALRDTLDMYDFLPQRDKAFLTRLVQGTLERMIELDYILDLYSKTRIKKQKPVMRAILRSGTYQIMYMDSVPDSAACNEAVKLAAKRGFSGLKGYVNGVLRAIARNKENLEYPDENKEPVRALSVRYSVPEWIAGRFISQFGIERCGSILKSFMDERPDYVWVDESRADFDDVLASLKGRGIAAGEVMVPQIPRYSKSLLAGSLPVIDGRKDYPEGIDTGNRSPWMRAIKISGAGGAASLAEFKDGLITVQDLSSMAAVNLAAPEAGDFVLDVCAAPGGKSLRAAAMIRAGGHVQARDLTGAKTDLIQENKDRCKMENLSVKIYDAARFDSEMEGRADIVIADLPCSGLGVMGRKADIKYRASEEGIISLAKLQKNILNVCCRYVKPGGCLIYSTCTLTPEENEQNTEDFLSVHPEFTLAAMHRFLPDEGCDGFFAARLERSK